MGNGIDTSGEQYQHFLYLKEILEQKKSIDEFSKWIQTLSNILERNKLSLNDYLKLINFKVNDENLTNEFFRYCLILSSARSMPSLPEATKHLGENCENFFKSNILGPICFVTPEIGEMGKWSTIGGLGVMVYDLAQGLAQIGQDVIIISPYYNENKAGKTDYLANDPHDIKLLQKIEIELDEKYEFEVHFGTINDGVKYYFLKNPDIFPKPYPDLGAEKTVREISCIAKGSLQLLCDLKIIPSIILTNDWFTGFTPAYAKNGSFGDTFKGTKFIHICHNLEESYEGRIYPSKEEGTLEKIYKFEPNWVINTTWKETVINPSRCALMMSDQWATVSESYKNDLLKNSPLKNLLSAKETPFAHPNGIFREKRLKLLNEDCKLTRDESKKYIQQKYFGYENADYTVPVFSFIGRITKQKGILLILEAAEEMIKFTNGKINILVGGTGDKSDPYVEECIKKIDALKEKFPYAFWAKPDEYFEDCIKVNKGSDFALMPSLFEPGGIVQHEFFIAGTPVIAYKTGGLKDSVKEFLKDKETGNGITFEGYDSKDLIAAMKRALELFNDKDKYKICQKNAIDSAIDVVDVARAWCKEFFRLENKIYFNLRKVEETPVNNIEIKYDEKDEETADVTFMNKIFYREPKEVFISGDFDEWKEKHPLHYDEKVGKWVCTIKIKKGKYLYKYIVDENWEINFNELSITGSDGIVNNLIYV